MAGNNGAFATSRAGPDKMLLPCRQCRLRSGGTYLGDDLMPAARWRLHNDRPVIQIEVSSLGGGPDLIRTLVADTGAGSRQAVFQLVLDENDCLQCGGMLMGHVPLGGAYSGSFPVYLVNVR